MWDSWLRKGATWRCGRSEPSKTLSCRYCHSNLLTRPTWLLSGVYSRWIFLDTSAWCLLERFVRSSSIPRRTCTVAWRKNKITLTHCGRLLSLRLGSLMCSLLCSFGSRIWAGVSIRKWWGCRLGSVLCLWQLWLTNWQTRSMSRVLSLNQRSWKLRWRIWTLLCQKRRNSLQRWLQRRGSRTKWRGSLSTKFRPQYRTNAGKT